MGARGLIRAMLPLHFLALLLLGACRSDPAPTVLDVYAATSLTDVLDSLATRYERQHPEVNIRLNLAASSTLARQIAAGAPADFFVSAHPQWVAFLAERGLGQPIAFPLENRLLVVGLRGGAVRAGPDGLQRGARVAVGDPAHVPVGMYAREWLACLGWWDGLAPHLVPALDTRAAVLAVQTGAADLAVAYTSDVLEAEDLEIVLRATDVCHPEIRYAATVLRGSGEEEEALRFAAFVRAPEHAEVWKRYGFSLRSTTGSQ